MEYPIHDEFVNRPTIKAPTGEFEIKAFCVITSGTMKMEIKNLPIDQAMMFIKHIYDSHNSKTK